MATHSESQVKDSDSAGDDLVGPIKESCAASLCKIPADDSTIAERKNLKVAKRHYEKQPVFTESAAINLSTTQDNKQCENGQILVTTITSDSRLDGQDSNEPKHLRENTNCSATNEKTRKPSKNQPEPSRSIPVVQKQFDKEFFTVSGQNCHENVNSGLMILQTNTSHSKHSVKEHRHRGENSNSDGVNDKIKRLFTEIQKPYSSLSIPESEFQEDLYAASVQECREGLDEDESIPDVSANTNVDDDKINSAAEVVSTETSCTADSKISIDDERDNNHLENNLVNDEQLAMRELKPILNGKHVPGQPYAYQFADSSSLDLRVYEISAERRTDYRTLKARIKTYLLFQSEHVPAIQCAKAGFISKTQDDTVYCVWCALVLRDFHQPVDVFAVHQLRSSSCDYLRAVIQPSLSKASHLLYNYDIGKKIHILFRFIWGSLFANSMTMYI